MKELSGNIGQHGYFLILRDGVHYKFSQETLPLKDDDELVVIWEDKMDINGTIPDTH